MYLAERIRLMREAKHLSQGDIEAHRSPPLLHLPRREWSHGSCH